MYTCLMECNCNIKGPVMSQTHSALLILLEGYVIKTSACGILSQLYYDSVSNKFSCLEKWNTH
uniref:Uncharacterized protein n=1 Tax=Octopus bimaculoides TaxID=37653 RepID=A0A0L8IDG7_OCTBM